MPSDPGELLQLLGRIEAGAAGGPDDVDAEPVAEPGLLGEQVRGGVQQDVRRLERLDAADEEQHDGVLRACRPLGVRRHGHPGRTAARSTPGGTTSVRAGSAP